MARWPRLDCFSRRKEKNAILFKMYVSLGKILCYDGLPFKVSKSFRNSTPFSSFFLWANWKTESCGFYCFASCWFGCNLTWSFSFCLLFSILRSLSANGKSHFFTPRINRAPAVAFYSELVCAIKTRHISSDRPHHRIMRFYDKEQYINLGRKRNNSTLWSIKQPAFSLKVEYIEQKCFELLLLSTQDKNCRTVSGVC